MLDWDLSSLPSEEPRKKDSGSTNPFDILNSEARQPLTSSMLTDPTVDVTKNLSEAECREALNYSARSVNHYLLATLPVVEEFSEDKAAMDELFGVARSALINVHLSSAIHEIQKLAKKWGGHQNGSKFHNLFRM